VLAVALSLFGYAACSGGGHRSATVDARAAGRIPLLVPWEPSAPERDTPPAVRRRIEREERALLARARAAAKLPATAAAGCKQVRYSSGQVSFGAPPPRVTARIIGHHVEVVFAYPHLPRSDACRPFLLTAVVYTGRKASSSFSNAGAVGSYRLRGPRGRVVLDLTWFSKPQYHLIVNATTINGRRGPDIDRALRCPRAGCLPGYRPAPHAWKLPEPVLPLRGVDRSTLEATFRYVVAGERWPTARRVRCPSLHSCELTYVDPAFATAPYRIRYRIAGEQVRGCWMGMRSAVLDPLPYPDAGRGRLELAGCGSWLR
jgi:hypothetical protein